MTAERIELLKRHAGGQGLDALVVVPGPNLFHLTGLSLHLSERPTVFVVPTRGAPGLVVPGFEEGKVRGALPAAELFTYDDAEGPTRAFERARDHWRFAESRIGVEGRRCRFLELELLGSPVEILNADSVFAQLRMRKDAAELEAMTRAVKIAEAAFEAMTAVIRPGVTEKEIAAELLLQLVRGGSDPELPFQPFAAGGVSGANPHATPSDREVRPGELITIDWGASSGGYFSDITRTVAVGGQPVPERLREAYEVVRLSNEAGRRAAQPGATGQDVDRAAREVIRAAGYGEYFTHRTGHGLGLEGHEEPDMNEGSLLALAPGMTFTVEPGIYIPDLGGIRIEDDVVITEDGSESLTTLPRELITLP